MISAALPQEEVQEEKSAEQLNKVDDMTEIAPEQLEPAPQESENDSLEQKKDEQPPINQNGDDEEALRMVEQLPEYPGGMVEFMKWLTKTLKYPEEALKRKIEGKVMISFIVDKDGSLSDIKVVKPANPLLDAEALRVARMMPKWKPGTDNGKVCRTMIAIPIVFEI
jgi:protein TonB